MVGQDVILLGQERQFNLPYPKAVEGKLLKPIGGLLIPARTKQFTAADFYKTGTDIYVDSTFAYRLAVNTRQPVDFSPKRHYVASLLKVNAYDTEIKKHLPESLLSSLEDIAWLIKVQPKGISGFLLSSAQVNIFYVRGVEDKVFAVGVNRSPSHRWNIKGWELNEENYWVAGNQVIYPGKMLN